jgi:hypothetical protein
MKQPTSLVRLVVTVVLLSVCAYLIVKWLRQINDSLDIVAGKIQLLGDRIALLAPPPIEVTPKGEIGFGAMLQGGSDPHS